MATDDTITRTDTELFIQWRDSGESYEGFTQDELARLVEIISDLKANERIVAEEHAARVKANNKILNAYIKQQNELAKLYAAQRDSLVLETVGEVDGQ